MKTKTEQRLIDIVGCCPRCRTIWYIDSMEEDTAGSYIICPNCGELHYQEGEV